MNDIITWDKAIGRKVRSSDGQDLGRVQSITRGYIQTKEGRVSKNYYFIPKHYLSGYDGDRLWVSITKDEVKSRFEREAAPEPEFEPSIPAIQWDKMIGKKLRSSDGKDLGDVESVARDYIEVKEGVVSKKHYYIPKRYIQGFDGNSLYAALARGEAEVQFERDSPPPP